MNRSQRALIAIVTLATCGACSGPSLEEHLARAEAYRTASQLPEAIIEYQLALQIDAQRGDIRLKLADTLIESGNANEALRQYVRAADLLPADADVQLKAGNMLLLAGAFEDARSRANKVLERNPKNADAIILLANAKAGLKDLDGALSEYQEAATLNPSDRVYAGMGIIQLARGEREEAEASFRMAIAVAPDSVNARLAFANFLWSSRRHEEAERELRLAFEIDSTNVLANRALGVFYLTSNRTAEAEPYFKAVADQVKTAEAILALADYYVMTRKLEEARGVLRELARNDKAWAVATTRLAGIDAIEGFRAQGLERIREVLGRHPEDGSARLLMARLLLADGRREEALAEATTVVKQQPNTLLAGEAYMLIGQVHRMLDRPEAAIKAYQEVLSRLPQSFGAAYALASLHVAAGSLEPAKTYIQQALSLQPGHPLARSLSIRILLLEGKTADARHELAALRREYPNAPAVLSLEAAQARVEGRLAEARSSYMRVAELAPHDLEALAGLLQLDMEAGRPADAVRRVEAALASGSRTSDLLILAGRVYAATGEPERAEDLLKQAIDLDPARLNGYLLLAQLYVRQNRLADAQGHFETLVARNPTSVSTNSMLGILYDMRGRFEEAEKQYEKTLALDSEAAVAANNLAYRLVEAGRDVERALELAQTARRRLPNEPNVADTLGWIYYRKGMNAAAIRELQRSVELNPKDPLSRYHLGMAYSQAGELEKAKITLREALALGAFSGADEAKRTLAALGG